ncbi:type III pantothenate kinase [Glaciimonas sp. PAMC28666]|uniref:type III pantothenate kinase n=1 Tax=Glaciimonas sp. PAMC28666 TaxID=2807626 RepID=UPI0019640A24|nr:type III pantothenate kinase [Glaciimonas sp. PAMC28666]QRX84104.1 type III pantothenate kinase [Glaciimonas sp. PAMC28666]
MGLLLIDAGNTRIKWTLSDVPVGALACVPPAWQNVGSVAHAEIADLPFAWRALPVTRVLISNVAGNEIGARLQETLRLAFDGAVSPEWFASVPQLAGVSNGYRNPLQLGCDRFASAIGARSLYPHQALLLATCGTATTIDMINADGRFIGGMILPGLGLMANALAHGTAQLPLIIDHAFITSPFANNTEDAIISGCIAAQVGAISTALTLQRQHHPEMAIKCILTGGSAGVIAPYLLTPYEKVDHLVLTGLWTSIAAETER